MLAYTSLMFLAPAFVGLVRKRRGVAGQALLLTASSVAFHTTHALIPQVLDTAYAHCLVAGYTVKGLVEFARTRRCCFLLGILLSATSTGLFVANKALQADPIHAAVQLSGNIGWLIYLSNKT